MEIPMYLTVTTNGEAVDEEAIRSTIEALIAQAITDGCLSGIACQGHIKSVTVGIYDD